MLCYNILVLLRRVAVVAYLVHTQMVPSANLGAAPRFLLYPLTYMDVRILDNGYVRGPDYILKSF